MDQDDAARTDRAHRLVPVVEEVALRLQPELSDAEVDDVGPAPAQCAGDEAGAADDQEAPVGRAVVDQRRPRLAAPVRRGPHRRYDRCGDGAGKAVRRAVVTDDEGDVERAQRHWFTGGDDDELVVGQSARRGPRGRPRCRRPASRRSAAATTAESIAWSKWVCTGRTASSRSTPRRARQPSMRGSDGASLRVPTVEKTWAGEESVGHQRRLAVVDQQGGDARPT